MGGTKLQSNSLVTNSELVLVDCGTDVGCPRNQCKARDLSVQDQKGVCGSLNMYSLYFIFFLL